MKVKVKLFARYREITNTKEIELEIQPGTTVAKLKKVLKDYFPQLKNLDNNLIIAVNSEFTEDNQILKENDQIALLPPLSGG